MCPTVKFQVIILRGDAAITVETGRCEGETLGRASAQSRYQPSRWIPLNNLVPSVRTAEE